MFIDVRTDVSYLHNNYALVLGVHVIRILELETYHTSDPYTHGNERQYLIQPNEGSITSFYIHRNGKLSTAGFKGGSYKGLDIASNGGILVRSIMVNNNIIEGPSLVVDKLLSLYSGLTLNELETSVKLVEYDWPVKATTFYTGARAGLSFRNVETALYYISVQRSSIVVPKKYKETFFVFNADRTDIPYKTNRYLDDYNTGSKMEDLKPGMNQMQVYGFLHKCY
jgi:hypothetical protein